MQQEYLIIEDYKETQNKKFSNDNIEIITTYNNLATIYQL